jgi:hypothetical protein
MDGSFFIGVHPGLEEEHIGYMADTFKAFIASIKEAVGR